MRLSRAVELEQHLTEATIVITTPFHPAYMTRERIEKAKNLKLILTAGIGSDHIDLHAAADHGLTVAECVGAQHCCCPAFHTSKQCMSPFLAREACPASLCGRKYSALVHGVPSQLVCLLLPR